jgi:RNA polymerase sigma-70 factor (ECF subfamily)
MIARGMFHLAQSAAGREITTHHLEAGIAACHCAARDYESTDWPQILALYDRLVARDESPVAALNRAVAVGKVHGPAAALAALAAIQSRKELRSYYLLYALLGEFEAQMDRHETAAGHFRKSLALVGMESERAFLSRRLAECLEPAEAWSPVFRRRGASKLDDVEDFARAGECKHPAG